MSDYGNERLRPACLGMLCDTSDYNIDGSCVVMSGKRVFVGVAVCVVGVTDDGCKIVRNIESANDTPYGVAMFSQDTDGVEQIGQVYSYPYYNEHSIVPVVSHGRIWTLGYSVNTVPHQKVKFNAKGYVNNSGEVITNWGFTGGNIPYIANSTRLVGVQVLQNANIVPPPPPPVVLVESATITTDKSSPQPNNVTIQCVSNVLPANADDKTGKWSIDATNIATVDPDSGLVTPVGGDIFGNFNITWTANDTSKTKATIAYRVEAVPTPEDES